MVPKLVVDVYRKQVYLEGKEIQLAPREYQVLEYLCQRAGQLVTKRELLELIWPEMSGEIWWGGYNINQIVYRLRKKMGDDASCPAYLETRRGYGYILHNAHAAQYPGESVTRNQASSDVVGGSLSSPQEEISEADLGETLSISQPWDTLTPREREIFMLLGDERTVELTAEALACRLGIKKETVKKHLHNIYRRLGVQSRAGAVLLAVRAKQQETMRSENA